VNDACPASPVIPVTVTVYAPPVAPAATVKDPDTAPAPDIEHNGPEMILLGDDVIVHEPASPAEKPDPETRTLVPGRPDVGVNAIAGSTVNM